MVLEVVKDGTLGEENHLVGVIINHHLLVEDNHLVDVDSLVEDNKSF